MQHIEARVKRAMNVGDYEENNVNGEANWGSNDDDDCYPSLLADLQARQIYSTRTQPSAWTRT